MKESDLAGKFKDIKNAIIKLTLDKANRNELGTAASKNTGTSAGNVPVLDPNGKLVTSILPAFLANASVSGSTLTITKSDGTTVSLTDTNTWRGIQDNLTSQSTTDSLSAKQGYLLANGDARDSTKLPLAGGTMTGPICYNSVSLPQKTLSYIMGIDAFASGGESGWQSKADFLSGYALVSQLPAFSGVQFNSGNSSNEEHDCSNATANGHYYYGSNGPSTSIGASTNDGALYVQSYSNDWVAQIAQDYRNGNLFVRGKNNGSWQSWKRIACSGESQPASDVYPWAKASSKPSYTLSEISSRYDTLIGFSKSAPSIAGSVSPFGMAMSSELGANRLSFINPNALYLEYSTDGSNFYQMTSLNDTDKVNLVTLEADFLVGRNSGSSEYEVNSKSRITIIGQDASNHNYLYCSPKKLLINVLSSGGMNVTVEYKTGTNVLNSGPWEYYGEYGLSGWSGWNEIPLVLGTLGGGYNRTGNVWQIRLTFKMTSKNTSYPTTASVNAIRLFADNCWNPPSTMARINHLYGFDAAQTVYFPSDVYANGSKRLARVEEIPFTISGNTAAATKNVTFYSNSLTIGDFDSLIDGDGDSVFDLFQKKYATNTLFNSSTSLGLSTMSNGTYKDTTISLTATPANGALIRVWCKGDSSYEGFNGFYVEFRTQSLSYQGSTIVCGNGSITQVGYSSSWSGLITVRLHGNQITFSAYCINKMAQAPAGAYNINVVKVEEVD